MVLACFFAGEPRTSVVGDASGADALACFFGAGFFALAAALRLGGMFAGVPLRPVDTAISCSVGRDCSTASSQVFAFTGQVCDTADGAMPQRMRPVDDVIKRVLHDRLFDPALVRVGYVDRLTDGGAR